MRKSCDEGMPELVDGIEGENSSFAIRRGFADLERFGESVKVLYKRDPAKLEFARCSPDEET
jgi:hypothetical protein